MTRRLQADLLLLLVCAVWGATFVVVKEALADASTMVFLALRLVVGGLALLIAGRRLPRHAWGPGLATGFFLFLGYFLQTKGLRSTTVLHSAFITGLCVILVPAFGALWSKRLPGRWVILGLVLALAGLTLLTNPGGFTSINTGDAWTLGCTVAFAIHILLVGHFSPHMPAAELATGQVISAAILAVVCVPWAEPYYLRLTPRLVLAVLITGLFCTAIGYYAQAWAQRFTTSTHTALIFSSEPVFAWLTSLLVLGEHLTGTAALGALLILAGMVLAELSSASPEPVRS